MWKTIFCFKCGHQIVDNSQFCSNCGTPQNANVSSIVVCYYDHDSENETVCRDAIVEALEISFCDSSKAKEYTDQFSSIGKDLTIYDDAQIVTSYSLTSEANVRISCDGSFADEWTGRYCIYKN